MNFIYLKNRYLFSRFSIGIIILFSYLQTSSLHIWKWERGVIFWDTISYYAYLPALFVHKDLSLEFIKENPVTYENRFWPQTTDEGKYVIKTTYGLAILYFPFFITAHLLATPLGFEANGFSEIYHLSLALSPLLYLFIGLFYLKRILKKYFSDIVIALTLISVGLATNLLYYTSVTTMSHTYSFCLISIFLYLSIKWIEKPGITNSLLMGLLLGIISLIRPTNSIMVIFPLLFGIQNLKGLRDRIFYFLKKPHFVLIIVIMIFLVWLPQMIYWHQQTGSYLYFSYGTKERFFWSEPAIFRGLFSFRKGWLIYSPIMIFSLIGIALSLKNRRDWFLPLIIIIPVSIYIMLCWWTWWYAGGFGMRPIIDYYALLAIPLALSISMISKLKPILKYSTYIIIFSFLFLGVLHHMQAVSGAIHWDSMTWKTYKYNFGHLKMTEKGEKYLIHPDYEKALIKREWKD